MSRAFVQCRIDDTSGCKQKLLARKPFREQGSQPLDILIRAGRTPALCQVNDEEGRVRPGVGAKDRREARTLADGQADVRDNRFDLVGGYDFLHRVFDTCNQFFGVFETRAGNRLQANFERTGIDVGEQFGTDAR